jgi:hypothetical protein
MLLRRAAAMACVALMGACSESPPRKVADPVAAQGLGPPKTCLRPLKDFCGARRPCLSFSETLPEVRQFGATASCYVSGIARSGTCGDFQFTQIGDGFVSETRFFDQSGTMVAARFRTDEVDPWCKGIFHYGQQLTCSFTTIANYCQANSP